MTRMNEIIIYARNSNSNMHEVGFTKYDDGYVFQNGELIKASYFSTEDEDYEDFSKRYGIKSDFFMTVGIPSNPLYSFIFETYGHDYKFYAELLINDVIHSVFIKDAKELLGYVNYLNPIVKGNYK